MTERLPSNGANGQHLNGAPTPVLRLRSKGAKRNFKTGPAAAVIDLYVEQINACWQKAVASIIETGRKLIEAKDALDYGDFGDMFEQKRVPFSQRAADMLMAIAKHPIISDSKFIANLPPSWGTLYDLTLLPERELQELIADGTINPETSRKQVREIADKIREHGCYRYARVIEAIEVLIAFAEKWPNPDELAEHLPGSPSFDEEGDVDLEKLAKLPTWLEGLHATCVREQQESAERWLELEEQEREREERENSGDAAAGAIDSRPPTHRTCGGFFT